MEVKCFNKVIALTQATKTRFFALKTTHLSIARTFNHIKFLRRCKKHHVIPKGLRLRFPLKSRNSPILKQKFERKILLELIDEQCAKLQRLLRTEARIRNLVQLQVSASDFDIIWDYITTLEKKEFLCVRARQVKKFDSLLQENPPRASVHEDNNCRVTNLSSRALDTHELCLLEKGLQFVPFRKKMNQLDIAASSELSLLYSNSKDSSLPQFFDSNFKSGNFGRDNLRVSERLALKRLKADESICILNADKGNSVVVMDKIDYTTKLDEIVHSQTYSKLKSDPSRSIDNKIRKIVTSLKKTVSNPKSIASRLIGHNSRDPSIYGCPKIHKTGSPLRPIITTFGSVTEMSAKFVANILKFYTSISEIKSSVSNTVEVIKDIKSLCLPDYFLMVSFDITNLFGSIDISVCKSIITDIVNDDPTFEEKFDIPKQYFFQLLDICLNCSYFKFNDEFYQQNQGIPMGSPCSPALADLYMKFFECQIFKLPLYHLSLLWKRYVDDIISLWLGTLQQLNCFLESLNSLHPTLKFTMEVEQEGSLPFLDAYLKRSAKNISVSMYSKPTSSGILVNYKSFHPPEIKTNLIKGETIRCLRISDTQEQDLKILEDKFVRNNYPTSIVHQTITKTVSQSLSDKPPTKVSSGSKIFLPYMGNISKRFKKKAKSLNLQLVSKRNPSLGSHFSSSFKYKTGKNTNIIYKIPCSCKEFYVGETGKDLATRIKRHKYDVRTADFRNGIAVHAYETGHSIDWNNSEILAFETNLTKRKIKEALYIKKLRPTINLNLGFILRCDWSCLDF